MGNRDRYGPKEIGDMILLVVSRSNPLVEDMTSMSRRHVLRDLRKKQAEVLIEGLGIKFQVSKEKA